MADGRAALDVFVGDWTQRVLLPDAPAGVVTFEWVLGGRYLQQRSDHPQPEVPDSLALLAYDDEAGTYTQHYFDSRGVTRVYRMTLEGGTWTLLRDEPDFSPLHFTQRYVGTISADGDTIEGRWEQSHDGGITWELDFGLRHTRR